MLEETWIGVEVSRAADLALVLDASQSAHAQWPKILNLANDLIARFQRSSKCLIYFLGDTQPYTPDDLNSNAIQLFAAHRQRGSLLSPLLEVLAEKTNILCIVLCVGRIFDLEDWLGIPITERMLLVNLGDNPISGDVCPECEASVDQVVQARTVLALLGAPIRLELSGKSVMPFFWDNPAYRWRDWKLAAEEPKTWSVHVGVLCMDSDDIRATTFMPGKFTQPAQHFTCSPQPWLPNWTRLCQEDARIFKDAIHTGKYVCPFCANQHRAEELRCRQDQRKLLGRYVYSFLQSPHEEKFVLLKHSDDFLFACYSCEALRLTKNGVAVHTGSGADVYEFDHDSCAWVKSTDRFKQYTLIQDQVYAIAV